MASKRKTSKWSKPVETPQAEKWLPRKGDVLECTVLKIINGKYGTSYLVQNFDDLKYLFLPSHQLLERLLESISVKEGQELRITCTNKGSRKAGDVYKYELQTGKGNAPF